MLNSPDQNVSKAGAVRQLEFDLPSPSAVGASTLSWTYRFDKDGLIEDRGETRYVYGHWDRLFGCWRIEGGVGRSRERIPRWRLFNENGVWRDHGKVRHSRPGLGAGSGKWRYEANAAFAGYLSGIPHRIRSVVAPFGCYQWLALDLVWQEPGFAHFLDEENLNGRRQYVFACFSLAGAAGLSRSARHRFGDTLLKTRRTAFLERLASIPCSRAALRVIGKLGAAPLPANLYRSVIACMNDERTAKAFAHAGDIDPGAVRFLAAIPNDFLLPNVVRILLEGRASRGAAAPYHSNERLCSELLSLHRLFTAVSQDRRSGVLDALHRVKDIEALYVWAGKWRDRLLPEARPFPPPPFPAKEQLVPLANIHSIKVEARRMRNCLASLIPDVLEGRVYFYRWRGRRPATVMLERSSGGGWRFEEALGEDNISLDAQTAAYIENIVSRSIGESGADSVNESKEVGPVPDSGTDACSNERVKK